jgi:hypothetical protein
VEFLRPKSWRHIAADGPTGDSGADEAVRNRRGLMRFSEFKVGPARSIMRALGPRLAEIIDVIEPSVFAQGNGHS